MSGVSKYITQKEIQKFIRNELWNGTVKAALQHNKTYKEHSSITERENFRNAIRTEIEDIEHIYHKRKVTDIQHLKNLKRLEDWSNTFKHILISKKLNIGTCQKFLNIHLKGVWCAGILKNMPPHAPLDAIIKKRLKLKMGNWTEMGSHEEYQSVIDQMRTIAEKNDISIAELELLVYNNNSEHLEL